MSKTRMFAAILLGCTIGWFANDLIYPPRARRPILNGLWTVVKNFWWVPLVLDDEKQEPAREIGPDGYPLVHHGRTL